MRKAYYPIRNVDKYLENGHFHISSSPPVSNRKNSSKIIRYNQSKIYFLLLINLFRKKKKVPQEKVWSSL